MDCIVELQELGYKFSLNGDKITYNYIGVVERPPEAILKPLFEKLIANKQQAIQYLKSIKQAPSKIEIDIDLCKDYDVEVQRIIQKANQDGIRWERLDCYKKARKLVLIGVKNILAETISFPAYSRTNFQAIFHSYRQGHIFLLLDIKMSLNQT